MHIKAATAGWRMNGIIKREIMVEIFFSKPLRENVAKVKTKSLFGFGSLFHHPTS